MWYRKPVELHLPSLNRNAHGLKVLSVGNSPEAGNTVDGSKIPSFGNSPEARNVVGWKQKLSIAASLDTLFPNLEPIETQAGANSEQWECIYDSVKMCQTSRLIHTNRRHSASSPPGVGKR